MNKILFIFSLMFFMFFSVYNVNAEGNIINNCESNFISNIQNTESGGLLEIDESGICEISSSIIIDNPISIKIINDNIFTLRLINNVDNFIEINSNNVVLDGFNIDVNKKANKAIVLKGSNINISHNNIFNILYDNGNISGKSVAIYLDQFNESLSGSQIDINLNQFYNIENKKYEGILSEAYSIYIDLNNFIGEDINIKGNIFNGINAEKNNQIYLVEGEEKKYSNIVSIENNSFVGNQDESIYTNLSSDKLIINENTYDITDSSTFVDEDADLNVWTIDKAEHLAKKVLFGVTNEKIQELFNAGSREAAVDLLFPSKEGPDRTEYNNRMNEILDPQRLIGYNNNNINKFYTFKKMLDPYEAKAKLFGIFEDTFSVDTISEGRINYSDIEDNHNMLYSHTLGNYKEMVKRNLYNNGERGDYALGEYLDLFNQKRASSPNENYAREILQLFLMDEHKPTESDENGDPRNYTEEDVNKMAKIIFGFEADENHNVSYNIEANTNDFTDFLEGDLKNGDSFPFYNSETGEVDIQKLKESINGNNGLPDNIIDYIFSKREDSIALFLADKFYRFYIAEHPTRAELDIIAGKIKDNNFEIYPTIKWLLASDMMYRSKSLKSIIYKNPLELVIGTTKMLGLENEDIDFRYMLSNLNWIPYHPDKIFGRDGYDDNSIFYTPYIGVKWATEESNIVSRLIEKNIDFFDKTITDPELLLKSLEDKLYFGKELDLYSKEKIIYFLTHDIDGNNISIDFNNSDFINKNLRGTVYMMLTMPEYILQSGYNYSSNTTIVVNDNLYENDNKIVFIKASGGLDWLHAIIPKKEYDKYLELRGSGSITGTGLLDLNDDYYINSSLKEFKDLYDKGNLRVINRVGTPNHSRGHNYSSKKITSITGRYNLADDGIFGHFIKNTDAEKTIVLGAGYKPYLFDGGRYIGIGSSAIFKFNYGKNYISSTEREYIINTLKNILENREYSGDYSNVFINSSTIDTVAQKSKENGGREGSGYNMEQNFTFLESLYNEGLGNGAWMRADGGYDNHRNEKDYLNGNFKKVAERTTNFFNSVKDKHNVTIVIFSEFGRTNKLNGSNGVDHGKGGGMFIISNNDNLLKNQLPNKMYGNNLIKDSRENYLGVGVDYRSVYSSLFKGVFSKDISNSLGGKYNINSYADSNSPGIELLNINHEYYNDSRYNTYVDFVVDDVNFFGTEGSNLKFEYWTDTDPVKEISSWWLNRYRDGEKKYSIKLSTSVNKKYYYKITIIDNQYNKTYIDGNFITPGMNLNDTNVGTGSITFLKRFKNLSYTGSIKLDNNIILSSTGDTVYSYGTDVKMLASSGTYIEELTGEDLSVWNGAFIPPVSINLDNFIGKSSVFNNRKLLDYKLKKIIKIGSDNLGIGMNLNKNVTIEVDGLDSNKRYTVLFSTDGIEWNKLENESSIILEGNNLRFTTNHFTYFVIVEADNLGNPELIDTGSSRGGEDNGTTNNINIGYYNSGGGVPKLRKDICPYGDFSESYYDKTCGVDPDAKMIYNSKYSPESLLEVSLDELNHYDNDKYLLYLEIFNNDRSFDTLFDEKAIIIKKLREGYSLKKAGDFELIYAKNFKYNSGFEKLVNVILSKDYNNIQAKEILISDINKLVILYSLFKENGLSNETKKSIKNILISNIKSFISDYKKFRKISKKRIIRKTNINVDSSKKEVSKDNTKISEENISTSSNNKIEIVNKDYVYKVSVSSVILKKDAYWKEDIGTLYKGDIVEQITNIHPKGFFKIRVIESKEGLNGKEGFIFAKYLEE